MEFEILTTQRLILRKSTPEVFHFVFNNYTDDELKIFLELQLMKHLLKKSKNL
jgi:ribosomal-protein-alanine N-acetyltransferase